MSGLLLTPEEKLRFVSWLENEIYTTNGIVEQMKKISVPAMFVEEYAMRVNAFRIVLNYINSAIEEVI